MTNQMKAIEKEKGEPIETVLVKLYEELGNQSAVAKALGTTQGTVSLWLTRLGYKHKTVLVKVSGSEAVK